MDRGSVLHYLYAALQEAENGSAYSAAGTEQAVQHARAALQFAFGTKNEFLQSLDGALKHAQADRLRSNDSHLDDRQETQFNERRIGACIGQLKAAISAISHGWESPSAPVKAPEPEEPSKAQLLCPHCGHETWQRSAHAFSFVETVETTDGDEMEIDIFYELRVCEMCSRALLYTGIVDGGEVGSLVYPADATLPRGVSGRVTKSYAGAKRLKKSSPSAFSGQVRKAFEFACKDKGAQGANLEQLIEWMLKQGHLPHEMGNLGHVIRLVGNQGMHDEEDVTYEEAEILDELFLFALNYMYGFREKLEVFDKELAEIEARRVKNAGRNSGAQPV